MVSSGKIVPRGKDKDYNDLLKLAAECKAELEIYKDISKEQIRDLEKEIRKIDDKIQEEEQLQKKKDSGNIINAYA